MTQLLQKYRHAFTLIELMVVVTIVMVLAAMAIPTMIGQQQIVKTSEASAFIAEIRQRQESYRSVNSSYAAVSGASLAAAEAAWNPNPGSNEYSSWEGSPSIFSAWTPLKATPDGPVRFGYITVAGNPDEQAHSGTDMGLSNDFWFVTQAQTDLDGDGTRMFMEAHNMSSRIYIGERNDNNPEHVTQACSDGWD